MKFFEAVELGWGLVTPRPHNAHGCALGMAHKAVGGSRKHPLTLIGSNFQSWPWLRRQVAFFLCPACGSYGNGNYYGIELVTHLFDDHLFASKYGAGQISRDQFIDYLRQLEDQATAGEQVSAAAPVEIETPTEPVLVTA